MSSWIQELKNVDFNKVSQESIYKKVYELMEEAERITLLKNKYAEQEEKQEYYNSKIKDIRSLFNELTGHLGGWISDSELSSIIYNFNQIIKGCRVKVSLNKLKDEIEEAKQYPDAKSYATLDKTKLNYKPMTYYEMVKGAFTGKMYQGIQDQIITILRIALGNKYDVAELLSGHVKMSNGTIETTLQFAIDYYKDFRIELKQAANVLEFQNVLEKYSNVFNRYGTPQVGMMNYNSSRGKSVWSPTDHYTMPLGSAIRNIIEDYITRFNTHHGLDTYKFREPIEQSKLYKYGFSSYEEFYKYANAI